MRAVAPWLPVVLVGVPAAYFQMFTSFARYDDEGYLLVSLSEFVKHGGHLYDQVFSQYGPFYYLFFGGLFRLTGHEVTNDSGRIIVVVIWVATATIYGVAAYRLTARLLVGIAAQLVAFATL